MRRSCKDLLPEDGIGDDRVVYNIFILSKILNKLMCFQKEDYDT